MSITCITSHAPQLEGKYKKLVDSGLTEKDAAIKVAIDEHKALFDELNKFKASIGIKLTKEDKAYVSPEIIKAQEPVSETEVVDAKTNAVRKLEVEAANRVKKLGDALGFGLGKPVSKSQLSNTPLPVNTTVANGFDTFKKRFGETAAKAIRENIPFALDYPTEFAEFITKKIPVKEDIAFVVKNLSQRLDGLFRLESDKNIETVTVKNKTPEELSKEAGYVFHRPESEKDILAFKKDFENGEVLCTYNDVEGRMQGHFIFWLRRNDAESVLPAKKVTQEYLKDKSEGSSLWRGYLDAKGLKLADGSYDLSNLTASRQDPYGTSSMSVQIGRRGGNISIKNRYNHTVNNPDATFGNDLNTIIDGLNDAVFGIEGVPKAGSQELRLPDNITSDTKGRFFKYDQELENIYVSQHGYVSDGEIILMDKSYQRMIDDYVFDSKSNTIWSVTMSQPIIKDITNINFEKNKITVDSKDGKFEFELVNGILNKLESDAEIINSGFLRYNNLLESVSLPNARKINDEFLYRNKLLKSISLPSAKYIGDDFLASNERLNSISLPNLSEVGNNFLYNNRLLNSISLPVIDNIGKSFLYNNEGLESISLGNKNIGNPSPITIDNDFLYYNVRLDSISLPYVEEIRGGFLYYNTGLKSISLPDLTKIGSSFLMNNKKLENISLPKAKYIGSFFLRGNDILKTIDLPNVKMILDNFLRDNHTLKNISLPNVEVIGNNFLQYNEGLESISLPNVERIGSQFLYNNIKLKSISLPKIEKIGDYFMGNNESVERPTIPQPTSKSQLTQPNIAQLIAQFRDKGIADAKIEEFLKSKGFSTDDIQSAMGKKVVTKPVEKAEDKVIEDTKKVVEDLDDEELNVMGITKKEARRQREELGEEQYQYDVKSRSVLEEEATRLLTEGYSVPKLIKRINKDPKASDVEIELLRRYFTSLTARINSNPTAELLQERKDLMSALDLLKTSAGRTVQAFDGLIAIEDNLASYLEEESKYSDLSENEIKELTEKYNKAKEALDKYEELEKKAAEDALNKKLQSEINKTKKTRAEVKGDFRQKRQQYITDARAELKKIRNSYSAVIVPYQRELIALAPFAKKMAQSYAEEGIYELKQIVKGIKDEFINDIPDLTDIDVKMMLSGQYPNTRKTRNAKLAEIRDLEIQAKLEIKIEQLEKGIVQTPNPVQKRVKSEKVEALEKEIALIKRRNPELTYPSKIQARQTFYKNRIKELKKEIDSGEFDVIEAPITIVLDDETLKLKDEFIKFKEETRIRREKKEHEALSEFEKVLGVLRELAEIKRVVQTSIDVSIPMRQGVSIMFNPRTTKLGVVAYGEMLNTMFSEKKYNRLMYDIEKNPEFLRSKDDGIVYTDLGSNNIELRDESHPIKGFIQRIPILGKGIKISARAAAAWTNYARFELYQRQVRFLKAQGKTRENSKEAYEQAAARVMTDTGRGKLPILSDKIPSKEGTAIKQALGTVFYGARLYSSTFRKLNPFYYLNPNVDKTVRIEALKDMAGYVASQIIVTTAVAALLGASVSFDYDEPDFMKIRIGKRVIDLTAGQSVYIRTFLRLVHAAYNRFDPTVSEKDANKYAQFAVQSVGTFWRNKLAPNTSYIYSAFSGKNSIGEKFDPYEIIKIYPMYTDDIVTAFKDGSPLDALFILPIGMSGIGYQEYSKDIRKARVNNYVKDKDLLLFLKSKKLNIQGNINQEVYDLETNEQVKMTKEQSDKYEKIWSETIIDRIKAEKANLNKLSEEELDKEVTKFKSDATRIAKEAVTGVDPYIITIESKDKTYELTPAQIKERKALNKEYIDEFGDDIIEAQIEIAIEQGKSPQEAKIIAEKKLKSKANANSKIELLEKYTDDNDNITLKIKE